LGSKSTINSHCFDYNVIEKYSYNKHDLDRLVEAIVNKISKKTLRDKIEEIAKIVVDFLK